MYSIHCILTSVIGLEAQKYMETGKLVPDEVMLKVVTREMEKFAKTPWLLDGYPRTVAQAKSIANHTKVRIMASIYSF